MASKNSLSSLLTIFTDIAGKISENSMFQELRSVFVLLVVWVMCVLGEDEREGEMKRGKCEREKVREERETAYHPRPLKREGEHTIQWGSVLVG